MLATTSLQSLAIIILLAADSENPLDNQSCGTVQKQPNSIQTRIVGGSEASSGAWPWQVAVLDKKKGKKRLICGGTLISSEFVLTAAHCVTNIMHIVAGDYDLGEKEGHEQERRVIRTFKHPYYNKNNVDNDIALLKLESPLELTQRVWPACLPDQNEELSPESKVTILGWGATSYSRGPDGKFNLDRDDILRQAEVPVVDFDECKNSYGDDLESHNVICAGYKEGRVDSCAGDSGGPLLFEKNNRWQVYGVTSMGDECGKEAKYGIYSKTSAYVDWIKRIVVKYTSGRTSFLTN